MELKDFELNIKNVLPEIQGKRIKDIKVREWGMSYAYYFEFDDGTILEIVPEHDEGTNLIIECAGAKLTDNSIKNYHHEPRCKKATP